MSATRIAAVVLALVISAWFALGIRQATEISAAQAIISAHPHPTAAQVRRAQQSLDAAATLNPDRTVDLERIRLLIDAGDTRPARVLATRVVAAEPQNLDAWVVLAQTAATDPQLFGHALSRVRALEPLLPGG